MIDWTNNVLCVLEFKCLHWIKDEITENEENLEQWPNMIFSSEASKKSQETQKVRMEVGRLR